MPRWSRRARQALPGRNDYHRRTWLGRLCPAVPNYFGSVELAVLPFSSRNKHMDAHWAGGMSACPLDPLPPRS